MSWTPETVADPGWFAVRLRPEWGERRRRLRAVGELLGKQHQPRELARYAYDGGFTDAALLVHAVAVILAESQGYDRAVNDNPDGTVDRGIWQLNTIHKAVSDEVAYDPELASKAAHGLWLAADKSFDPWVAYQTGVYLDDTYVFRAVLGVANFLTDWLARDQGDRPDRAAHHHLSVPLVSEPQLRHLYPQIAGI